MTFCRAGVDVNGSPPMRGVKVPMEEEVGRWGVGEDDFVSVDDGDSVIFFCRRVRRMGHGPRAAGHVMGRLVVRNLSQDGVEGSSASVVNLFDPKEGLGRGVLEEAFVSADIVDVAPEVLLDLKEGLADLLLEKTKQSVVHAFIESLHRGIHRSSKQCVGQDEAPSAA
jgi:hypothetical protein